MKMSFTLIFILSSWAWARSSIEFVGQGQVESVHKFSKAYVSVVLKVNEILKISGDKNLDNSQEGLTTGQRYNGFFAKSKAPKVGDNIYFIYGWSCDVKLCSDKQWVIISKKEALAKAGRH